MYVSWAMAAKICIFSLGKHGHSLYLLHIFPSILKLFDATLAELEEPRTV